MLGFLYLILILGWILIVIFLKCKKSLAPHLAFPYNSNYSQSVSERQCSPCTPSVHVIQLQEDDLIDPAYIAQHNHLHHSHYHSHHRLSRPMLLNSADNEGPPSIGALSTYPTDAVINPAYTNDENYIINGPPPSYEEVMSKPDVYPKVHDTTTTSPTTTTLTTSGSIKSNDHHQENI